MTSPVEYTPIITSNTACVILDNCIKTIGLETDDVTSIQNHPSRTTLLNDVMPDIAFNKTATFYRGTPVVNSTATFYRDTPDVDSIAEYIEGMKSDELDLCDTLYEVEKALNADDAEIHIIDNRKKMLDNCDKFLEKNKNYSHQECLNAQFDMDLSHSVIDEAAVARLITVGIAASHIPEDIDILKTSASKDATSAMQQRIYNKLHQVVRSVNSRIAKTIKKKQPKSVFLAHARFWQALEKPTNVPQLRKTYKNFRREFTMAQA